MQSIAGQQWALLLAKSELRVANVLKRGKSEAMSRLNRVRAQLRRMIEGTQPAVRYDADYDTRIAGIPCGIVITYYEEPEHNNWGHPDNREPDQPADVEFFVVNDSGYPAPWLEKKVDYQDLRIHVLDLMRADR